MHLLPNKKLFVIFVLAAKPRFFVHNLSPKHNLSPINKDNTSRCVSKKPVRHRPSVRPTDRPSVRPSVHPTDPSPLHMSGNGVYATLLLKGLWGINEILAKEIFCLKKITYTELSPILNVVDSAHGTTSQMDSSTRQTSPSRISALTVFPSPREGQQ